MLLIYVDKITERLIYTFDFIFKDRKIDFEFTNDWKKFNSSPAIKFSYSNIVEEGILQINPSDILFDEALFEFSITKSIFYKEECFSFDKILDPFASIFYILSRYEEYLIKQRDFHDRFEVKNSILFKFNIHNKVVCDRWAEDILNFLEFKLNTNFQRKKISTSIIPSFDIDNTFAFKWKESFRKILSKYKDKFKKDTARLEARSAFELGKQKDPYDTFDEIVSISDRGFDVKLFWLLGEYSKYDKNLSANDIRHQNLINELSQHIEIGLHPSYNSNKSNFYLKNEKDLLEKILKKEVRISRQHFLKLKLPETYTNLISLGFKSDYSMGFAETIGFRAGTSRSHNFFNLRENRKEDFVIHPFAYMDGTLNYYLKLSPAEAKVKIKELFDEVKLFGGDFIFIWHNETISNFDKWNGWKEVLEFTLNLRDEV